MTTFELICFWTAILLLAAGFFSSLLALIFKKRQPLKLSWIFIGAAFVLVSSLGIHRWILTDHPPFVTLFESMITSVWFILLICLIVRMRMKSADILSLPISVTTFLLLGWSSSLPPDASPLSAALTNVWLFVHASFATAGAASFLICASFGILYLLGKERLVSMERIAAAVPEHKSLTNTMTHFLLFGLILWGVMIVSGAIWAHVAWGRYWAWDPIEVWSLIGWLLWGLLYHSKLTFKISGRLFSWMTIIAALTVSFALWGVQYVYETIHNYG